MHTEKAIPFALCALLLANGCANAASIGKAEFIFEPGYMGGPGTTIRMEIDSADISVSASYGLQVSYGSSQPTEDSWHLSIFSPDHQTRSLPDVGCYEHAHRGTFAPARPGLDFSMGGAGCNQTLGRFRVRQLDINPSTQAVERLAVDFIQYCEGRTPAVFGKIRLNTGIPLSTPPMARMFTTNGRIDVLSPPDEPVGDGRDYSVELNEHNFLAWAHYPSSEISPGIIEMEYTETPQDIPLIEFDVSRRDGKPLTAGIYPDVRSYLFGDPTLPGMALDISPMMCGPEMRGQLDVFESDRDPVDGLSTRFEAFLSQQCADVFPTLVAYIDYSTSIQNGPLVNDTVFLDGMDPYRSWPLKWDCE